MRIGSLCSGYGGLELAVQAVLGGDVAWHSEYEPPTKKNPKPSQAAARVLAYRYPGVPNLGDMTAVDWSDVAPVDILAGGTPCQDVSHAGKRVGMRAGTRSGLWSAMVDAIDVLRPRLVVWENVRGVLSAEADSDLERCPICVGDGSGDALRALGRVLGDLADSGYDARWCGLRASDVGAPHNRFRVFVVAHPRGGGWRQGWAEHDGKGPADAAGRGAVAADSDSARPEGGEPAGRRLVPHGRTAADSDRDAVREQPVALGGRSGEGLARLVGAETAAVAQGDRRREGWPEPAGEFGGPHASLGGHPATTDADRDGRPQFWRIEPDARDADGRDGADTAWGPYEPAIRRWERILGRPAPAPARPGPRGALKLSPEFDEWLMGLPAGWITDVPGVSWNDALKMCGNGVVPQQAAAALRHMLDPS